MKSAIDVQYIDEKAYVGVVEFDHWTDAASKNIYRIDNNFSGDYIPGKFYQRELTPIVNALNHIGHSYDDIVIDAYVYLKPPNINGLGMHLANAISHDAKIIGIAKNKLKIADKYVEICRGKSKKPLYVSSNYYKEEDLIRIITAMHGDFRIPTLIKLADMLSKGNV